MALNSTGLDVELAIHLMIYILFCDLNEMHMLNDDLRCVKCEIRNE